MFWQLFSFRKDEEGRFDALSTFLLLRQNKIFGAKYADGGRKKNLTRRSQAKHLKTICVKILILTKGKMSQ